MQKSIFIKEKINKLDSSKDAIKKMERQATDWGKKFTKHVSDKILVSRVHK